MGDGELLAEAVSSGEARLRLEALRRRFLGDWLVALDRYQAADEALRAAPPADVVQAEVARREALAVLVQEWHGLLDRGYREAHHIGAVEWGAGRVVAFSEMAASQLRKEQQLVTRFALDVAQGPTPRKRWTQPGRRSALYATALEGAYHRGVVDGAPPNKLIYWRMSPAEHCDLCPSLAAGSPYTAATLPTVPKMETPCRTACKCHLEFVDAPPRRPPTPEDEADDRERARPLAERLGRGKPPTPPPGKRLPTDEELVTIDDLRHRMAHADRRAAKAHAAGDEAERDRWLKARKDLNATLIRFTTERGIWAPPTFSATEVLNSVDVRAGDVHWLTHIRGIDGTTIHRATADAVAESVEQAKRQLADILGHVPPSAPAVPDFDDLLRRFSTTPGLFDATCLPDALREAEAHVPDPAGHHVVQVVGMGAAATLRAAVAVVEELAETGAPVAAGPLDERWPEDVLRFGLWLEGDRTEVDGLVRSVEARLGGARRSALAGLRWLP